ncbi:MAG: hypothetical protein V7L05_18760 [Nostoc sp.]
MPTSQMRKGTREMREIREMREMRKITNAQCPMPHAQCPMPQSLDLIFNF